TCTRGCNLFILTEPGSKRQDTGTAVNVGSHTLRSVRVPGIHARWRRSAESAASLVRGGMMKAVATDGRTLLERPLDRLVGARTAKALEKLDLHTAGDLLRHAPRRYVHRGELVPFARAVEGESVTVV